MAIEFPFTRHPLSYYVEKLEREEPFSLMMYGDGELAVAMGKVTRRRLSYYQEYVSGEMVDELAAPLKEKVEGAYLATDENILNDKYHDSGKLWPELVSFVGEERSKQLDLVDGTIWDHESRLGGLGPFLKELHNHVVVVVGNPALRKAGFLHPQLFVEIPPTNAYGSLTSIELSVARFGRPAVYLFCMGLGAIPLIMRMRRRQPEATYLDLGSVLDVFVGLGRERGWRGELYSKSDELAALRAKHLEGVCSVDCRGR